MNLMSSIAKTLVGSDIAIVRVAPVLWTGRTPYFRATSPGTTLMTVGSISKCARSIEGTPNCWERVSVMSCSLTAPIRISASPNLPPSSRWDWRAASTCSGVTSFALTRRSPSFTAMGKFHRLRLCAQSVKRGDAETSNLIVLDRLQLSDERPDLQLRVQLDRNFFLVVGQPEDEVLAPADQSFVGTPRLNADRSESSRGRRDRLASHYDNRERKEMPRDHRELDRLVPLEVEKADVVERGERIERGLFDPDRLAVAKGDLLAVVELDQVIANALALDGVLLEAKGPESLRIDPGGEVIAHEKNLRKELSGDRRQLEFVRRAPVELRFLRRQSQLATRGTENGHRVPQRFSDERRTSFELRLLRDCDGADGEREKERCPEETKRFQAPERTGGVEDSFRGRGKARDPSLRSGLPVPRADDPSVRSGLPRCGSLNRVRPQAPRTPFGRPLRPPSPNRTGLRSRDSGTGRCGPGCCGRARSARRARASELRGRPRDGAARYLRRRRETTRQRPARARRAEGAGGAAPPAACSTSGGPALRRPGPRRRLRTCGRRRRGGERARQTALPPTSCPPGSRRGGRPRTAGFVRPETLRPPGKRGREGNGRPGRGGRRGYRWPRRAKGCDRRCAGPRAV